MLKLRVYTSKVNAGTPGADGVFYSQSEDGPHYRWWRDEEGLGQWRFTRLHPAEWNPKILSRSNQKEMPVALQARLAEHYMGWGEVGNADADRWPEGGERHQH